MAVAVDKVVLQIIADNKQAIKGMLQVEKQAKTMAKKSAGFFSKIKTSWLAWGIAITATIGLLRNVLKLTSAHEKAVARLTNTLVNNGKATKEQTRELLKYNDALQKTTGFSNDEITAAQAMLGTFKLTAEEIKEITPRLLDMAAALEKNTGEQMSLQDTAVQVGKVFTGYESSLSRMGVTMTDAQKKALKLATGMEKVNIVTSILDENFKGTAETIGKTFVGATRIAANAGDDLKKAFGTELQLAMLPIVEGFNKIASSGIALRSVVITVRTLVFAFQSLIFIVKGLLSAWELVWTPIIATLKVFGRVHIAVLKRDLKGLKEAFTLTFDETGKRVKKVLGNIIDDTKEFSDDFMKIFEDQDRDMEIIERTAHNRRLKLLEDEKNKREELTKDEKTKRIQAAVSTTDAITNEALKLGQALQQLRQVELDNFINEKNAELAKLDETINQEIAMVQNRIQSGVLSERLGSSEIEALEKQKETRRATIERQIAQKKKQAWEKQKKADIATAWINTLLGVTKSIASGGFPLGIIMGALALAAGIANIAAISAQKYPGKAEGGEFRGKPGVDKNLVRLSDGEYVVNRDTAQKNRGFLDWLNYGNVDMSRFKMLPGYQTGGEVGGGSDIDQSSSLTIDTIVIQANNADEMLESIQEKADDMGLKLFKR